jgi:chaperonin GroES
MAEIEYPDEMEDMAPVEGEAVDEGEGEQQQLSPEQKLAVIMQIPNIAEVLPADKLGQIAQSVVEEYAIDKASRAEWEDRIGEAMDLAMMVSEEKSYPFDKAANIKYPLLPVAALQFNARSYPAIVAGDRVAKCKTFGRDPDGAKKARAERVSEHLSYQLLNEAPEWEEDTDKMLVILPIVGSAFRKVWYDHAQKRNRSRLISSNHLIVHYFARSLEDVPRITEEMRLYPYEISERIRGKRFIEFDYAQGGAETTDGKNVQADPNDMDAPHLFLEQHRLLDLDEDGYPEPYIVTVHHASQKVCRIAANFDETSWIINDDGTIGSIRRNDYYVKYQFLPSPDGGFYGWGFGWLLRDIGESINTTLNMIMDAGHVSTIQGGLVSGQLGIKEKSFRLKPGEWRVINGTGGKLADSMMPISYNGPSPVLFQLLGMLLEAGKEVAAIKDVLTGDSPSNAPVGTTLAVIEQGLQMFTAIYKRIHRALKVELGLHAKLNAMHLDPEKYNAFFDGEPADPQADYAAEDMDIVPVSDPNSVSKMQRIAKAQLIREVGAGNPMMDQAAVTMRVLDAADIDDVEDLMAKPQPPNPEEEALKRIVAMLAVKKQQSEILKDETAALKNVADAEAAEEGAQLALYQSFIQFMQSQQQAEEATSDGQGGVPGMEGQPSDAMGVPPPQGDIGAGGFGAEAPAFPVDAGGPGPMGGAPITGGP